MAGGEQQEGARRLGERTMESERRERARYEMRGKRKYDMGKDRAPDA